VEGEWVGSEIRCSIKTNKWVDVLRRKYRFIRMWGIGVVFFKRRCLHWVNKILREYQTGEGQGEEEMTMRMLSSDFVRLLTTRA
jgi:hypothetical protein